MKKAMYEVLYQVKYTGISEWVCNDCKIIAGEDAQEAIDKVKKMNLGCIFTPLRVGECVRQDAAERRDGKKSQQRKCVGFRLHSVKQLAIES